MPVSVSPCRDLDDDVVEILEVKKGEQSPELSPSSSAKRMPPPPPPPIISGILSSPPDPKPTLTQANEKSDAMTTCSTDSRSISRNMSSNPEPISTADNHSRASGHNSRSTAVPTSPAKILKDNTRGSEEVLESKYFKRPGPASSKRGEGNTDSKTPTPSACSSNGTIRQIPTVPPAPAPSPKNLIDRRQDSSRSHRISLDTATSDDSSDGLSETFSSQKFLENVESSPDRAIHGSVSEAEEMDLDLENRPSTSAAAILSNSKNSGKRPEKGRPFKDVSPASSKNVQCMNPQLRVTISDSLLETITKKKLVVIKLKQLFIKDAITTNHSVKKKNYYCMRMSRHDVLTEKNTLKIGRQFERSLLQCQCSSSRTSSSSSSSEQGDDSSVAKKRKVSDSGSSEDSLRKRKRMKSVDSSDSENDFRREAIRKKKELSVSKSRGESYKATKPPVSLRKRQNRSVTPISNAKRQNESVPRSTTKRQNESVTSRSNSKRKDEAVPKHVEKFPKKRLDKKVVRRPAPVPSEPSESDSSSSDANDNSDDSSELRIHENKEKDNQRTMKSPSPAANISSNTTPPKAALPRRTMVIDNAPMPRKFLNLQARQSKFEEKRQDRDRERREQLLNESKGDDIACDPKELRKQKLKEVEANKQREREKAGYSVGVPKPKVHEKPKIYINNRSRNQGLLESIIGPETVQKELQRATSVRSSDITAPSSSPSPSVTSTATTETSEPKKPLLPPHREIPIPSAVLEAQMPLNHIRNLQLQANAIMDSNANVRKKVPPAPVIQNSRTLMQKPGVAAYSYTTNNNDNVAYRDYHHGKPSTSRSRTDNNANRNPSRSNQMSFIPPDEAYQKIVRWNPKWLKEQEEHLEPPPVAEGYETVRTLYEYSDFKTYAEVFFPLILHEIWATITKHCKNPQGSSRDKNFEPDAEFDLVVFNITGCTNCPMLSRSDHEASSVKDTTASTWTKLQCQVLTKRANEMSCRKDLAILKLAILDTPGKEKEEKQYREFFGFVLGQTESVVKIDNSVIPHLLREKHPEANFLQTMTIVIRSLNTDTLDKSSLGTIKRIAYISSKLRDIKALNRIIKSEMGKHIIGLKPPTDVFDLTIIPSQHKVIPHVYKLNHKQRSVIGHVCEKLKRPESQLMLLHGPPGTGKTLTIVSLILQILLTTEFCRSGQEPRVLVCTPSNTAIDEIMRRVDSELEKIQVGGRTINMIRVGDSDLSTLKRYSVDELARKYEQSNSKIASIEEAIKQCNKEIADKREEIESFEKRGGSKATLESLRRELKDIDSRRKEHQEDISKKRRDKCNNLENKRHVLNRANLVCTTLNSCSNSLMCNVFGENAFERYKKKKPFLCCIVDEASQTTEPETLAPFLLQVDKLLLVGDPYQLGATVISNEATKRGYDLSLFARLHHYYNNTAKTPRAVMMLTDQYRMDPEILSWPNDYFYKGQLQTHCVRIKSDERSNKLRPYLFLNLPSQELSNNEGQISNEDEATLVVAIIDNLWEVLEMDKDTVKKCDVGVITPYAEQRNILRSYLHRDLKQAASTVEVDTVDSFQGREKDIIVMSCVRTDGPGFLKTPSRLNVALTRAKLSLIIIGDAKCLERDAMWKSLIEDARSRDCVCNIPTDYRSSPGFLKKRLYTALSPTKKPKPD